jgi:hypothetical protein
MDIMKLTGAFHDYMKVPIVASNVSFISRVGLKNLWSQCEKNLGPTNV